jgi:hypothetical protein
MRRSYRRSAILTLGILLLGGWETRAGIVTPDSISPMPAITSPAVNGTVVPAGGVIEDQYAGLGIGFDKTALAEINGVRTFTPMSFVQSPGSFDISGTNGTLFYSTTPPKVGVIEGVLVAPGLSGFGKTSQLSFEFINIPVLQIGVALFDIHGNPITNATVSDQAGPHGGPILTFSHSDITVFQVWEMPGVFKDNGVGPWGLAQIDTGDVQLAAPLPRLSDAPEPGTLALGGVGGLAFLCYARRRHSARPKACASPAV